MTDTPPRQRSTPLYRLVVEALEQRRRELGWTFEVCDAKSGLQRGYTAKMFRPDTPSGRMASWPTLQLLIDAMYAGEGFRLAMVSDRASPGAPTAMARLLGALELGGLPGVRALKVLMEAGVEVVDGAVIVAGDQADHKRENRRRKTRQTLRTKIRKDAPITAGQSA